MINKLLFALLLSLVPLRAAPVFTLIPGNGNISGLPGQTAGWGFRLTSDPSRHLTVVGSFLLSESNPSVGVYTDFIGTLGGPVNFTLAPNADPWQVLFDDMTGQGVGSFTFASTALAGQMNSGILRVLVEAFSGDPNLCGGTCLDETLAFDTAFSATASAVPEPGTLLLMSAALGGLGLLGRRRQQR